MHVSYFMAGLALVGVIGVTTNASAADFSTPRPSPPAPIPPAFTWTGPYAGVNAGYAMGRLRTKVGWAGRQDAIAADPAFITGLGAARRSRGSFTGGAQVGYNYQMGSVVLGVEADFNALKMKRSALATARLVDEGTGETVDAALRSSQSLHWLATLRPRIGWAAFDRFMVYGTGGLAVARASQRSQGFLSVTGASVAPVVDPTIDPAAAEPAAVAPAPTAGLFGTVGKSGSGYRYGWALGAGAEYAVTDDISVKGEFLHVQMKGRNVAAAPLDSATAGVAFGARNSSAVQMFRAGLNYRF
ncbi:MULTISPECIES: outer membrane beta-barrel protein [unclassified Chelatococcus]|uniref:outer membrane protein n=1 Tax=unclassified Chelatococcus TaxID=2638111 RepID=UPI001BCA783F|nr:MULTISPECIES: outer membrane beta-barrel protein [unclassified Chelatococcus]MBS7698924.1 porin family protein [Chelatococcus sp. YT9]MBX3559786.1 porin family protein [Chelatococcus sp.]